MPSNKKTKPNHKKTHIDEDEIIQEWFGFFN